jgi:hypothetical protein
MAQSTTSIAIGSSNFTEDGLLSEGEATAVVTLSSGDKAAKAALKLFGDAWNENDRNLDEEQIAEYAAQLSALPKPKARKIKTKRVIDAGPPPPPPVTRRWRDSIGGEMADESEAMIERETSWDTQGWDYYALSKNTIKRGDEMVLFDFVDKRVKLVSVMDATTLLHKTEDGKHLVAYREKKGRSSRKMDHSLWAELKRNGLVRSKESAYSRRQLNPGECAMIEKIIRKG